MRRLIRKAEANLEVNNGDLVDFGPYGKLYVCNADYEENKYWVTDEKENSKISTQCLVMIKKISIFVG